MVGPPRVNQTKLRLGLPLRASELRSSFQTRCVCEPGTWKNEDAIALTLNKKAPDSNAIGGLLRGGPTQT